MCIDEFWPNTFACHGTSYYTTCIPIFIAFSVLLHGPFPGGQHILDAFSKHSWQPQSHCIDSWALVGVEALWVREHQPHIFGKFCRVIIGTVCQVLTNITKIHWVFNNFIIILKKINRCASSWVLFLITNWSSESSDKFAQSCQSLHCTHTLRKSIDEGYNFKFQIVALLDSCTCISQERLYPYAISIIITYLGHHLPW